MATGACNKGFQPEVVRTAIERFLESARRPALLEPGETMLMLDADHYTLEDRPAWIALEAWDEKRMLVRRVRGIERTERGKLSLCVQRFAGREGELHLVDLAHPRKQEWERRGSRMVFRERWRRMLERAFPGWRVAELSSEPDLEHSLSPAYPRAILQQGTKRIAAIAAPPDSSDFPAMLSCGLIWLDYVRRRSSKGVAGALTFWAPSPVAAQLGFFLPYFDSARARFAMYLYSDEDFAMLLDPRNYGNVATELDPWRRADGLPFEIEQAEAVPLPSGGLSLRVAGLEFARWREGKLANGRQAMTLDEAREIAANLHALRNPRADRHAPVYQQNPEAWLESVVRFHLPVVDASLAAGPVYGQVPAIAGQNRTVIDLLAVDRSGRLAVIELKAAQDLHLPLQALDYWLRVKWHLDRGEFSRNGYFPGVELRRDPPRLLLVAPSLEFHPSSEAILGYFSPEVDVTRIGLNADWRENPRVMFRLSGAERPHE